MHCAAAADTLRIATFNTELGRDGPGLLLRDIEKGDEQVDAVLDVINKINPDIIALQSVDFDHEWQALRALNARLPNSFPHLFAALPNRGQSTGLDLNGDGYLGDAADAQGFGKFAGADGLAILSRFPIGRVVDLSSLLWADLPFAPMPKTPEGRVFPSEEATMVQRLSTTNHLIVPILADGDRTLTVMAFHAAPPVFDGPEDRNGLRNAGEILLWKALLDGELNIPAPQGAFVVLGDANLDALDGDGRRAAMITLLEDPRLQDPQPRSEGGLRAADLQSGANRRHRGPAELDTADWRDDRGPGNLRVDYILPSANLSVIGSGVFWPVDDQGSALVEAASRHRLVWVDLNF